MQICLVFASNDKLSTVLNFSGVESKYKKNNVTDA